MKKWTTGDLQARRAASRFMLGFGVLAAVVSVALLLLSLRLTPEQRAGEPHQHDARDGGVVFVIGLALAGAGWKLGSAVRRWEEQTGQSAKPFGWIP